jgi:putative transposase
LSEQLVAQGAMKVSRACTLLGLPRSQYYYKSRRDDRPVIDALQQLADNHPAYGFRKLFSYLRRAGHQWNHKRVYRVYLLLKMNKRRRRKRRLPARVKQPLVQQRDINQSWSMDFMSDALVDGRKFRTFNVIDDCSRETLVVEIATSLSAPRVVRVLEGLIRQRGKPKTIRVDNGPEFTSAYFQWWCKGQGITIVYIQPGRPMQNGLIERFNGTYRTEILNAYLFFDLDEVRKLTDQWMEEYNCRRPHEGLQGRTPNEYREQVRCGNMENSTSSTEPKEFTTLPHRSSYNIKNSTEKTV